MALKLAEAYVEITGRDLSLKSAMQSAEREVDRGTASMQGKWKAHALKAAFIAATVAGAFGIGEMVRRDVEVWGEAEEALDNLASTLQRTGSYSDALFERLTRQASGIMALTKYDDDAVVAGMAVAHNLGVQSSQLEIAARAAVGLAARYKMDLGASFELVGKASEGITRGLKGHGIAINDNLSAQEKFNQVLKIGNDAFTVAIAQAETAKGTSDRLKVAQDEIAEAIGQIVTPAVKYLTQELMHGAQAINTWIANHGAEAQQMAQDIVEGVSWIIDITKRWFAINMWGLAAQTDGIHALVSGYQAIGSALTGNFKQAKAYMKDAVAYGKSAAKDFKNVVGWVVAPHQGSGFKAELFKPGKVAATGDDGFDLSLYDEDGGKAAASKAKAEAEKRARELAETRQRINDRYYQIRYRHADPVTQLEMERNREMEGKAKEERIAIWADYADQIKTKKDEVAKDEAEKARQAAEEQARIRESEIQALESAAALREQIANRTGNAERIEAKNTYNQEIRQLDALAAKGEEVANRRLLARERLSLAEKQIAERERQETAAHEREFLERRQNSLQTAMQIAKDLSIALTGMAYGEGAAQIKELEYRREAEKKNIEASISDMSQRALMLTAVDMKYDAEKEKLFQQDQERQIRSQEEWRRSMRERVGLTTQDAVWQTAITRGLQFAWREPTIAAPKQGDNTTIVNLLQRIDETISHGSVAGALKTLNGLLQQLGSPSY
jgi:hypothetical protein